MSAVSSVGNNGLDLYQVLQNLSNTSNTATSTSPIAAADPNAAEANSATPATSGHHHHHHGVSSRIESAVTSALQQAPKGSDPNQVVKDAISTVLQGNATGTAATNNGGATNATDNANSPTQQSDFAKLLQSYGINSQQFEQDLQSALQNNTSGGSLDFSKLFKSFPPGSAIETTG